MTDGQALVMNQIESYSQVMLYLSFITLARQTAAVTCENHKSYPLKCFAVWLQLGL